MTVYIQDVQLSRVVGPKMANSGVLNSSFPMDLRDTSEQEFMIVYW